MDTIIARIFVCDVFFENLFLYMHDSETDKFLIVEPFF